MPPQTKIVLPKRGLCSKEIDSLGTSGVQIEALDFQNSSNRRRICEQELLFRNFCGLTPDYIKLRLYFGTRAFFWSSSFLCDPHFQIHINKVQTLFMPPPVALSWRRA